MPRILDIRSNIILGCIAAALASAGTAHAGYKVLYAFTGGPDGGAPQSKLIEGAGRNHYGTTNLGGASNLGTVYKLAADGTETVLHDFAGGSDGANPTLGGVIKDGAGNLYGSTLNGGSNNLGVAYRIAADGSEKILHAFAGASDGASPVGNLIADSKGRLFGVTQNGGGAGACANGCGTVFEITPSGKESVLHAFQGSDGAFPSAGLLLSSGTFYGTTYQGGLDNAGTVYSLTRSGTVTVLYSFTGQSDGAKPLGGLIMDGSGNLIGSTSAGGSGCGVIFAIPATGGTLNILYTFEYTDGCSPNASLLRDSSGNLYGTTTQGGSGKEGTIFELAAGGTESVLYAFTGGSDGGDPVAPLTADKHGNLLGTAQTGGTGGGTVFRLSQ